MPLGRTRTATQAIAEGMKHLGTPYVWGGNSLSGGIDCSHFIAQIYGMGWLKSTSYCTMDLTNREFRRMPYSYATVQVGDIVAMEGHVGMCGKKVGGVKYCLQSTPPRVCCLAGMAGGSWTTIQRPFEGAGFYPIKWEGD